MASMNTEQSLGTQPVGRLLFRLALPAITAQIINVLYNIVDRIFIGHIAEVGAKALTGLGVTMPVIMAVSAFAALISMGGAPRAAIMMGKKDQEAAERILGNCFVLLICMSFVLSCVVLLFGEPILLLFGASENTIGFAMEYLRIYACGTVFVQMSLGLNAFITTQGKALISMGTVLIGAALNLALDPILIFALDMGVKGAALATIFSQAVSAAWVLRFLFSKKTFLKLRPANMRLQASVALPCLALGLSPFIMQFTESAITVCFNTSLLKYGGDLAVGAMTILMTFMQFAMLPMQGLAQGSQPIVSYNYGAGDLDRVRKAIGRLITSCLIYSTLLWAVCMFAPQIAVGLFTNDSELTKIATWAVRVYMACALLLGAQLSCQQSFIALGNAKTSIFLAVLRKLILLIPLIFILPQFMENQVLAVFLAEPIADFCAVCATCALFYRAMKKLGR